MSVTESRDSGVEIIQEVDGGEGEEAVIIRTPSPTEVVIGETPEGNEITVESQHFIVLAADFENSELEQQHLGKPERTVETIVALSDAEGEVFGSATDCWIDDTADIEEGITLFEETYF